MAKFLVVIHRRLTYEARIEVEAADTASASEMALYQARSACSGHKFKQVRAELATDRVEVVSTISKGVAA